MNNQKMENGFCPFMTRGVVIPGPGGVVDLGAGSKAMSVEIKVVPIPCGGPDCQLWDANMNRCSMVSTPFIDYGLQRLAENTPKIPIDLDATFGQDRYYSVLTEIADYLRAIFESKGELKK